MIENNLTSPKITKEVIVNHALKILEYTNWANFEMSLLAKEIGITATNLYVHVPDKINLLESIIHQTDNIMLNTYKSIPHPFVTNLYDQLFDIVMCRLEVMQPYKKAFQNLTSSVWTTPLQSLQVFPEILESLKKMLKIASISTNGILGMVKIKAFAIIYSIILKEWLKEENSEPSDMMIEIDKLLKQILPILKMA